MTMRVQEKPLRDRKQCALWGGAAQIPRIFANFKWFCFLKFNLFLISFILWIGKLDRTQCTLWLWVSSTQIPWTFARYLLKCANIAKLIPWKQCDICFPSWASTVFHPLLFQVIRRGDRRPFYAPARYVMEVKTDQARLQVGKSAVVVSI